MQWFYLEICYKPFPLLCSIYGIAITYHTYTPLEIKPISINYQTTTATIKDICLLETKHEKSVDLKLDLDLKKNEGFPFPAEERSSRLVWI